MALGFRSGNPALTKKTFEGLESDSSNATMTLDGTVNKTSLSLLILLFCAYYTYSSQNTSFIFLGLLVDL